MSVDSALAVMADLGGVARTRTLVARGVARSDLTHAVHDAVLLRPRTGVYALPATSPATIESLSHRGVIACVTAARDYGLWVLDDGEDEPVHTWVHAEHQPTRVAEHPDPAAGRCCVFHRDSPIDEPSLTRVGVLHCLVQIYGCRGDEAFFAALESALRLDLIDRTCLARLKARLPARSHWLVDFARADADSGLESLLRLRLHRHGLSLASQVRIPGVGIVDFVIGDCLVLEADGDTHDGPARHTDRVRDAAAAALGFLTLRFDYALIVHDWPLVEAAILSVVGRNLHRSRAGLTW